ncbi:Muskelin N-terminus-domain-containing protein [Blastocladiella britannica]|nr:Muskelin N-terminus-domain-containing protein [Blastocladiella britannica]
MINSPPPYPPPSSSGKLALRLPGGTRSHEMGSSSPSAALVDPLHGVLGHPTAKLSYAIHSCSSYAPSYPPHNIAVNKPADQASRWTSHAADQQQWLTIVLDRPAIVTHLIFGKFHKQHVCNLKEFRVFAGMRPDSRGAVTSGASVSGAGDPAAGAGSSGGNGVANGTVFGSASTTGPVGMVEVFHGGLENTTEPEMVALRHRAPLPMPPLGASSDDGDEHGSNGLHNGNGGSQAPLATGPFPVQYIKIVPHASYQREFPYSIWYLEVHGVDHPAVIDRASSALAAARELELVRACLKYFRQRNYSRAFAALAADYSGAATLPISTGAGAASWTPESALLSTLQGVTGGGLLEAPLLSQLHDLIVVRGDLAGAERIVQAAAAQGLFEEYVARATWAPQWVALTPAGASSSNGPNGPATSPGPRGGHQLFVDPHDHTVFLYGGWDGSRDLADMWAYTPGTGQWSLVYADTGRVGGPTARSCHRFTIDPVRRIAYMFGRFIDPNDMGGTAAATAAASAVASARGQPEDRTWSLDGGAFTGGGGGNPNASMAGAGAGGATPPATATAAAMAAEAAAAAMDAIYDADFWAFDMARRTWTRISAHTANVGGPSLVYDHQLAMDPERGIVYVFGGKVVTHDASVNLYSGLYAYFTREQRWALLRHDSAAQELKPRVGHAMVFHRPTSQLLVVGGQRSSKEVYNHFLAYSTTHDRVAKLAWSGAPDLGATQRAAVDPSTNSVLVFSNTVQRPSSVVATTATMSGSPTSPTSALSYMSGAGAATTGLVSPLGGPSGAPRSPTSATSAAANAAAAAAALSGVGGTGAGSATAAANSALWVYSVSDGIWRSVPIAATTAGGAPVAAPCPRYAHSMVYDAATGRMYMFGGNPDGRVSTNRLDDFWSLVLHRASVGEVVRECVFELRKMQFIHLCRNADPMSALQYLQSEVAATVDHTQPEQSQALAGLSMHLFTASGLSGLAPGESELDEAQRVHAARSNLYDMIAGYFPRAMKQPEGSLVDYLPMA